MRFDLVIPTYNRAELLSRTLESVLRARRPDGLELRVYVVDNNSSDGTRATIDEFARRAPFIHPVFEGRQGRSAALNAGIAAGTGELVGMVDDDEEIAVDWFEVALRSFASSEVHFVGGPYYGRWETDAPAWLPEGYASVIGVVRPSEVEREFGRDGFAAILMGGNAVVRRTLLERVGPYDLNLGRAGKGLASGEDDDMFTRLVAAGGRGLYVPDLVIHHYIPATRLTKRYHRQWCLGHGISMGRLDLARPAPVAYLLGVPRYMLGTALRSIPRALAGLASMGEPRVAFAAELKAWSLAGFVYGKARALLDTRRGAR